MKQVLKVLLAILLAPIVLYLSIAGWSYLKGQSLLPETENLETVYLFRFQDDREVVIRDPFGQIRRSWGASADSIVENGGVRTVVFTAPAILKSSVDSIEPQETTVRVKGYMGVSTDDLYFTVDENGVISSDNWHGG